MHARLPGHDTETLWALPRTTQGPLLGTCHPLPGDQEAHQEADHDGEGHLSDHSRHDAAASEVSRHANRVKSQATTGAAKECDRSGA